jgi:hypothetical protein
MEKTLQKSQNCVKAYFNFYDLVLFIKNSHAILLSYPRELMINFSVVSNKRVPEGHYQENGKTKPLCSERSKNILWKFFQQLLLFFDITVLSKGKNVLRFYVMNN